MGRDREREREREAIERGKKKSGTFVGLHAKPLNIFLY